MRAAERSKLTGAGREEERERKKRQAGKKEKPRETQRERDIQRKRVGGGSREWQTYTVDVGGTFSKCRMTLPITVSREVERVSSGALSPCLACRAITTGT